MNKLFQRGVSIAFCFFWLSRIAFSSELLSEHSPQPLQAEASMKALEAWETPISGFFIRSHFGPPVVDLEKWTITIDGLVEKPLKLTLKDLQNLPFKSFHAALECSGNGRGRQVPPVAGVQWQKGAVGNAEWGGTALAGILKMAGIKSNARFLRLEGGDKVPLPSTPAFIRSIPITKALQEDTLIAWSMNREPMPVLHGGPLRLVLPGWYGQNWTKWLTHITLSETEDSGFFMKKGYKVPQSALKPGESWDSTTGIPIEEILVQSFIVSPIADQLLKPGQITIHGKAFSGAGPVSKVEVSLDDGKTWEPTTLQASKSRGSWQEFQKKITLSRPGQWVILSRATDTQGNQQPMEQLWNPSGYIRNAVDRVAVRVGEKSLKSISKLHSVQANPIITQKCLICHAQELIESQRLTVKQWEGVLKKMETFGVTLSSDEHQSLIKSLKVFSPENEIKSPKKVSYQREKVQFERSLKYPKGNSQSGAKLFQTTCFVCHGSHGEGKIGPRLMGRAIPQDEFWRTVTNGKRSMPPFGKILNKQNIADLEAYLQTSDI